MYSNRENLRIPLRLPRGVRIYAIGDVHGRSDLLSDVFKNIDRHLAKYPCARAMTVLLGDYIDRGGDSRGVLELILQRRLRHEVWALKGNHEQIALEFLRNPDVLSAWAQHGGLETLMSYGLLPRLKPTDEEKLLLRTQFAAALPPEHLEFLGGLPAKLLLGRYLFVHAGIRPGVPLNQQDERDMLWIRDEFLLHDGAYDFGIVVHGHSIVRDIEIRFNRINIDTGAYLSNRLSCIILQENNVDSFI